MHLKCQKSFLSTLYCLVLKLCAALKFINSLFTELTCVGRRAIATRAMKFLFEFFFAFRSAVKALLLTALVSNDIVANVLFFMMKKLFLLENTTNEATLSDKLFQ